MSRVQTANHSKEPKMKFKNVLLVFFSLSLFLTWPTFAQTANHVVISEIYGGGGNSGSTLKNDFVELYNPTSSSVNIDGWSVQYSLGDRHLIMAGF